MSRARALVEALNLKPHPIEGGYFRETHRTEATIPGPGVEFIPPGATMAPGFDYRDHEL